MDAHVLTPFRNRTARVAVIGLGYVGLPLAVAMAEAGYQVVGIDIDAAKVDAINRGESYIEDIPSERLQQLAVSRWQVAGGRRQVAVNQSPSQPINQSTNQPVNQSTSQPINQSTNQPAPQSPGLLRATTDYSVLADCHAVSICVPTPLNKTGEPDISAIVSAAESIAAYLHPGMVVVLESTTYPGTTREVVLPILQGDETTKRRGDDGVEGLVASSDRRIVGADFFLAFSPERIDPGRTDYTVRTTPKLVGGATPACLEAALAYYAPVIDHLEPVSSPEAAEMAKLFENTFRSVNIALANELLLMCERLGLDAWEVLEAAATKPFGFMKFTPGPGLGGHCIPIDPHYLSWKMRTLNYTARFIELASEINTSMPRYWAQRVQDALNEASKPVKGSRILVLGVSYKKDVGDTRESPALDIMHLLQAKGAAVSYHDPFVPTVTVGDSILRCAPDLETALAAADCVVVATDHSCYDWPWVAARARLLVDTRHVIDPARSPEGTDTP